MDARDPYRLRRVVGQRPVGLEILEPSFLERFHDLGQRQLAVPRQLTRRGGQLAHVGHALSPLEGGRPQRKQVGPIDDAAHRGVRG